MRPAWFAPKRFGYGATPVTWEGWLATAGSIAAFVLAVRLLHGLVRVLVAGSVIAGFIALVRATTAGEWRWRWGGPRS